MKYTYCPSCTEPLVQKEEYLSCKDDTCGFVHYNNPAPVVAGLVPNEKGEVLLVQRGIQPGKGKWALPAGFIDAFEDPNAAMLRELKEETGLEGRVDQLLTAMNPRPGTLNQILLFYLVTPTDGSPIPGSDAIDVRYFHHTELPEIAFSSHEDVINKWYT